MSAQTCTNLIPTFRNAEVIVYNDEFILDSASVGSENHWGHKQSLKICYLFDINRISHVYTDIVNDYRKRCRPSDDVLCGRPTRLRNPNANPNVPSLKIGTPVASALSKVNRNMNWKPICHPFPPCPHFHPPLPFLPPFPSFFFPCLPLEVRPINSS